MSGTIVGPSPINKEVTNSRVGEGPLKGPALAEKTGGLAGSVEVATGPNNPEVNTSPRQLQELLVESEPVSGVPTAERTAGAPVGFAGAYGEIEQVFSLLSGLVAKVKTRSSEFWMSVLKFLSDPQTQGQPNPSPVPVTKD